MLPNAVWQRPLYNVHSRRLIPRQKGKWDEGYSHCVSDWWTCNSRQQQTEVEQWRWWGKIHTIHTIRYLDTAKRLAEKAIYTGVYRIEVMS